MDKEYKEIIKKIAKNIDDYDIIDIKNDFIVDKSNYNLGLNVIETIGNEITIIIRPKKKIYRYYNSSGKLLEEKRF